MALRDELAKLRAMCNRSGFVLEKHPNGAFKLVWAEIGGDAVMNPATRCVAFTLPAAVRYLRRFEGGDG